MSCAAALTGMSWWKIWPPHFDAYVASTGRRTIAAVVHELKVWRTEGVETGEQADAHLKLLALRQSREQYVSSLLDIARTN